MGQDTPQKPSSFSAVIKRPSPQPSSLFSSGSGSAQSNVASTSFLQSQPSNYFNPLIAAPICTPVVTTETFLGTQNTFTNVPHNYSSPLSSQFNQGAALNVFNNQPGQNNLNTSFNPISPSNQNNINNTAGISSSIFSIGSDADKPAPVYQPFPVFQPQSPAVFQPILSSTPPVSSTACFNSESSSPAFTSENRGSSIFKPVSPIKDHQFNPVAPPPLSSSFCQPLSTPLSDFNCPNINAPSLTSIFQPVSSAPVSSPSVDPSIISAFSNFKITESPVSQTLPSKTKYTSNNPVAPILSYSTDYYQSSNVTAPSLFSATVPGDTQSVISAPPAALPSAPPKGGNLLNTYRIGNLKRPAYAPPPDLSVSATSNMAAIPGPVLPSSPNPAAVFTPIRDEFDNPTGSVNTGLMNQTSTGSISSLPTNSGSAIGDLSSNPTLPSYQSPVPSQAAPATVLPPSEPPSLPQGQMYRPPYHHWFYKKQIEGKVIWEPFSMTDSLKLENSFTSKNISPDTIVPTDGGRYDVDVLRRQRLAVYWKEDPGEVRRCSWFVKGSLDSRYTPYEEKIATMLEEEYKTASTTNEWNRQVPLPDGEVIILHSANAIAHHLRSSSPDAWGNSPQMQQKPRVVKRGLDEFDIPEGEPESVDHLLFLVHGIGKFCDLKFRPVTEVVDDFRSISLQLLQAHFRSAAEMGTVNRVEVLPVSWHAALHTEEIDRKLRNITLGSIHRLRQFTNDTLLDILFYTSPVFCETIVQAVGNELNRLYDLFKSRNPQFNGGVSLGGHSLGSLILFDMLCNQKIDILKNTSTTFQQGGESTSDINSNDNESNEAESKNTSNPVNPIAQLNRGLSYVATGTDGTGQPLISYPQLQFHPKNFFALGSPIGMFVTVRGIDALGENFHLPTCPAFFNIFHPFDPVAYRIETLILPDLINVQPVLIPHHKGRKRMHLELKDTMAHVGAAIKQRLMESIQATWNTVYQMAMFHKTEDIGEEVNKVLEDQLMRQQSSEEDSHEGTSELAEGGQDGNLELRIGTLNGGRRVDYVLQEAPLESFNEYIFALSSHVCYWESEDTMLMILKEIYRTMGITPDNQVAHQILPFDMGDRVDGLSSDHPQYVPLTAPQQSIGMDPTAPPCDSISVGPPPTTGFRRN